VTPIVVTATDEADLAVAAILRRAAAAISEDADFDVASQALKLKNASHDNLHVL